MRVKDLSKEELKALIREAVEEVLVELFGDPDKDLELRPEVRERLKHSLARIQGGEEGVSAEEAAKRAGLAW